MKAVIMDFREGCVTIVDVKKNTRDDIEDELHERGYLNSDCQWMVVDKLKIIKEKK